MRNVNMTVTGNTLTIIVDLSVKGEVSSSDSLFIVIF